MLSRVFLVFASGLLSIAPAFCQSTPQEALQKLKEGHARYLQGIQKFPKADPVRRLQTAVEGQKPIATILGCSDARVPTEAVFDRAYGDLFIVRVAGNVCQMAELASIEYGVNYLNTPLVLVLGHSKCGAVKAAVAGSELSGSLPRLMEEIRPAVESAQKKQSGLAGDALVDSAIKENVWKSIEELLKGSPQIRKRVQDKKVLIVGAIRDIKHGTVSWLGEHPQQEKLLAVAAPH